VTVGWTTVAPVTSASAPPPLPPTWENPVPIPGSQEDVIVDKKAKTPKKPKQPKKDGAKAK
jgi:hypothetical protein